MKIEDLIAANKILKEQNIVLQEQTLLLQEQIALLQEQIKVLQKMLFGQKSERFIESSQEQYLPGLAPDSTEVAQPDPVKVPAHEKRKAKSTPINTISYPEDLPVETVVLDLKEEEKIDPTSGKPLIKIGEEVTKRLAIKPSHFFIKQIVRYKYATAGEADLGIKTPELPDTILNRPACDESFIANVIVKKFCDHLPLNRQSDILTRQKIYVSRQTLSNYVNKVAEALTPLYELMQNSVFASNNIFVDETPIDELAPGKGKTDQGYVVTVVGGLSLNPENRFYIYFPDRKHDNFYKLLSEYKGVLHSDKYGAYEQLAIKKRLTWCPCFSHIRRKFIEAEGPYPNLRTTALDLIQRLFKIEENAAILNELERLSLRESEGGPLIDQLIDLAHTNIGKVLPKSKMGQAFSYLLGLKPYLKNYLKFPMARMDNNVAERALRPVAVGRKNWLFVGSEAAGQNTAILLTFAQTCRALKINPHEYFVDLLCRYQSHTYKNLEELLPANWINSRNK